MDKFWERYIQSRPAPGTSKGAFDAFAAANRDPGPRTMAQGGGIIGKPGGLVEPGVMYYAKKVKDMTSEEIFLQNAQSAARKTGVSGKKGSPEFEEFLKTYRTRKQQEKEWGQMREKKLLAHQEKFNPEKIRLQTSKLTKGQKDALFPTYDKLFKEEFERLIISWK
jgi:hypothetical protein